MGKGPVPAFSCMWLASLSLSYKQEHRLTSHSCKSVLFPSAAGAPTLVVALQCTSCCFIHAVLHSIIGEDLRLHSWWQQSTQQNSQ